MQVSRFERRENTSSHGRETKIIFRRARPQSDRKHVHGAARADARWKQGKRTDTKDYNPINLIIPTKANEHANTGDSLLKRGNAGGWRGRGGPRQSSKSNVTSDAECGKGTPVISFGRDHLGARPRPRRE